MLWHLQAASWLASVRTCVARVLRLGKVLKRGCDPCGEEPAWCESWEPTFAPWGLAELASLLCPLRSWRAVRRFRALSSWRSPARSCGRRDALASRLACRVSGPSSHES